MAGAGGVGGTASGGSAGSPPGGAAGASGDPPCDDFRIITPGKASSVTVQERVRFADEPRALWEVMQTSSYIAPECGPYAPGGPAAFCSWWFVRVGSCQ